MRRSSVLALVAAGLLAPITGYSQSVQHDDVEVIDSPQFRSPDEKKPDLAAVTKYIVEKTNDFREEEERLGWP